jgi:multidrug resistance efflux pump
MNIRRMVLLNVIGVIILLGVVYGGWNWYYQSTNFVSTDNAFVQGTEYPINAELTGKVTQWNVQRGATVTAGEVLGQQDTSIEVSQLGAAAKAQSVMNSVKSAAQITSPIDGTIINPNASVGQMAVPGTPLGYVVNLNQLYILANIKETDIRNVDVGDTVDISIDAFPNQTFKGTVQSIGLATNSMFSLLPPSDQTSGTYTKVTQTIPVQISLSGYSGVQLAPGMSASVHIHRKVY